jgi:hypothetical protein
VTSARRYYVQARECSRSNLDGPHGSHEQSQLLELVVVDDRRPESSPRWSRAMWRFRLGRGSPQAGLFQRVRTQTVVPAVLRRLAEPSTPALKSALAKPRGQAVAMRITIYTPGTDDQGEWEVDSYSIEGGALRLFTAGEELAAYSPAGWTHMQVQA